MERYRDQPQNLFFYLVLLTIFFCLFEISFFMQGLKAYFSDLNVILYKLDVPWSILPGILLFIAIQLFLHFLYCIFIWLLAVGNARLFKLNSETTFYLAVSLWSAGIVTILLANQYYFPNSRFADLMAVIVFNQQVLIFLLISLSALMAAFICFALAEMLASISTSVLSALVVLILCVSGTFYLFKPDVAYPVDAATAQQPNIILIGIDSLRPDSLGYFGKEVQTPFMDHLLSDSTVFTAAVTPLARTYPSWMSILTGRHPNESGIRFNLAQQNQQALNQTIAFQLQSIGYQTIFSTDETRFSNIDYRMGFDQVISPPIGLNDFLIGSLNDFPISNLLVNTRLGYYLFPYSYANRPAFVTYQPDTFLTFLKSNLIIKRQRPVFMAVHFCLPHFPYAWADINTSALPPHQRYLSTIGRMDEQLASFFEILKEYGFLHHAVVVILSDHGEALSLQGDRLTESQLFVSERKQPIPIFYPPATEGEAVNQTVGHGTDVLGLSQYHSLLAFKFYGYGKQETADIAMPVSLMDIKPTLLALLDESLVSSSSLLARHEGQKLSGISLAAAIRGKPTRLLKKRHLFLESDFSPEAIRTVYPDMRKVLLEGVHLFRIDPKTTRLILKDSMAEKIVASKQYADIYENWILAYYPQHQGRYMPILVNLQTGQWTNDLGTKFAQRSPAKEMKAALKDYYKQAFDPK